MSWWVNELGQQLHLACGRVGRYTVANNVHYLSCDHCGVKKHVPAPPPPFAHFTYGRTV